MNKRKMVVIGLILLFTITIGTGILAAPGNETEPNDTPGTANPLSPGQLSSGAITPTGDLDYYVINGVNTLWGFIALLETDLSTGSTAGTLTALGNDGSTVLQTDTGSWEKGSGIALQPYADGPLDLYLKVNEAGNDEAITFYKLRYYQTVVLPQPEVEPNEDRTQGNPSGFTMQGVINPAGDNDCFSFHGQMGHDIILALNSDPEKDGNPLNLELRLVNPNNDTVFTADFSGAGGNEFIEYTVSEEGVWAYCISSSNGDGNAQATYTAGLVDNGGLYFPSYQQKPAWLNPRAGGIALVGDEMKFRIAITNTSLITIPGKIDLSATYPSACQSYVSANPAPTSTSTGNVSWSGQKTGLAPGEVYSTTMTLLASSTCHDKVHQNTVLHYYITSTGYDLWFDIYSHQVFLPLVMKNP